MKPKMPSPVTKKSSREDIYEELEYARAEIKQQQKALNEANALLKDVKQKNMWLNYQIDLIRQVLLGKML